MNYILREIDYKNLCENLCPYVSMWFKKNYF
jgi:hypothetical protein